jgi:methyl-accepting chemotaxis protein
MALLHKTMEKVRDLSVQIKSVVEALNDFTERTNLLSMNASIEAAHAGTAGRGFAVIALEIKKLAAASAERAAKIAELISAIDQSVAGSFETSGIVRQSLAEIAAGAKESARLIHNAARQTDEQQTAGQAIAAESEKMAAAAQRIHQEVAQQGVDSAKVRAGMDQLSVSVRETGQAAQAIVERNAQLDLQARQLRQATDRSKAVAAELAGLMEQ